MAMISYPEPQVSWEGKVGSLMGKILSNDLIERCPPSTWDLDIAGTVFPPLSPEATTVVSMQIQRVPNV